MIKIMSIFGTRPEAIKMAPIIKCLESSPKIESLVCLTGQHHEMVSSVLSDFKISEDFNLKIMKPGQDLLHISQTILERLPAILRKENPDLVLVHGDTASAYFACLVAHFLGIKVGHVEAGLRSFDYSSPWPEELFRVSIAKMASLHFAPSNNSLRNLLGEKIKKTHIFITGNSIVDALHQIRQQNSSSISKQEYYKSQFKFSEQGRRFIIFTCHRRENLSHYFDEALGAVIELLETRPEIEVAYPMHPNPRIREKVRQTILELSPKVAKRWHIMEPLDYPAFIYLCERAYLILSDSGGLQEEAPTLGVPMLLLRKCADRSESLECGAVKLAGKNKNRIIQNVNLLLDNKNVYEKMKGHEQLYGKNGVSKTILHHIEEHFGLITTHEESRHIPFLENSNTFSHARQKNFDLVSNLLR